MLLGKGCHEALSDVLFSSHNSFLSWLLSNQPSYSARSHLHSQPLTLPPCCYQDNRHQVAQWVTAPFCLSLTQALPSSILYWVAAWFTEPWLRNEEMLLICWQKVWVHSCSHQRVVFSGTTYRKIALVSFVRHLTADCYQTCLTP